MSSSSSTGGGGMGDYAPTHSYQFYVYASNFIQLGLSISIILIGTKLPHVVISKLIQKLYNFTPAMETRKRSRRRMTIGTSEDELHGQPPHSERMEAGTAKQKGELLVSPNLVRIDVQPTNNNPPTSHTTPTTTRDASLFETTATVRKNHQELTSPSSATSGDVSVHVNSTADTGATSLYLDILATKSWVMGELVDLNAEDVRGSRCDQQCPAGCVNCYYCSAEYSGCWCCFNGRCYCWGCCDCRCCCCPEHDCCRGHIRNTDATVRRMIRIMLYSSFWASMIAFIDRAILFNASIEFSNPITLDNTVACPTDITNLGNADCFNQHKEAVNCQTEFFVPGGTTSVTCYQFLNPSLLSYLNAASISAALFTLVFGGSTMAFALALSRIHTLNRIRATFLLPFIICIMWNIAIVSGYVSSALALLTPPIIIVMLCAAIHTRVALFQRHAAMKKQKQLALEMALQLQPSPSTRSIHAFSNQVHGDADLEPVKIETTRDSNLATDESALL